MGERLPRYTSPRYRRLTDGLLHLERPIYVGPRIQVKDNSIFGKIENLPKSEGDSPATAPSVTGEINVGKNGHNRRVDAFKNTEDSVLNL